MQKQHHAAAGKENLWNLILNNFFYPLKAAPILYQLFLSVISDLMAATDHKTVRSVTHISIGIIKEKKVIHSTNNCLIMDPHPQKFLIKT